MTDRTAGAPDLSPEGLRALADEPWVAMSVIDLSDWCARAEHCLRALADCPPVPVASPAPDVEKAVDLSRIQARAALAAAADAIGPGEAEGFVLVPREPTMAMQNAGWRVIEAQGFQTEDTEVAPIYRAMLAAASKPGAD